MKITTHEAVRKNGLETVTVEHREVADQPSLIAAIKALEPEGWMPAGFGRLIHSDGRPYEISFYIPGFTRDFTVAYRASSNPNAGN